MIEIEDLSLDLGSFNIESLSLKVSRGEFFMVVGPSGAGKTILLEAIAGIRLLCGGKIKISGKDVTDLPPEKRKVALVYQDYALFPHMSVLHNIEWGLKFLDKPDKKRVGELIDLFKLAPLLNRSPETLSGGEQQRVSLARSLAVDPALLLLDEPLSALDPSFREELSDYLAEINKAGMTIIMVTHNFGEVLSLGSRVAVITDASLQQIGHVRTVFREPSNRQV
ncbi:MAG: ATP-binding cassette domain-containing protein, partial [Synergistaceae bacterium]|nr:ATP-binding cassette domain-containing protein [Synergistaceae bacterium]